MYGYAYFLVIDDKALKFDQDVIGLSVQNAFQAPAVRENIRISPMVGKRALTTFPMVSLPHGASDAAI